MKYTKAWTVAFVAMALAAAPVMVPADAYAQHGPGGGGPGGGGHGGGAGFGGPGGGHGGPGFGGPRGGGPRGGGGWDRGRGGWGGGWDRGPGWYGPPPYPYDYPVYGYPGYYGYPYGGLSLIHI